MLFNYILNDITMPRRNNLSEIEHTFHNRYWVKYGSSLKATATRRTRRNKESDPNDRTRVGFKVDAEWDDTRKLGLESRDLWVDAVERFMGVNASNIIGGSHCSWLQD
ncbi:hypothetical protein GLOIN_2v1770383 [Rhizophagus clarus]|uniref:Uncharacterized protein n=1 Tax=Rhizophagus clarus TaxID=94130 RepID=A0A8H3QI73_9GLOM|nr:hypothetical protein GLOIN_2v1770383 [Rhizophagus clarus]